MNSTKIRLIALLFALLVSPSAFSEIEIENCTPIYLYYKYRPPIDGIRRPHRAPGNIYLSLEVTYNSSISQLVFMDSQEHNYCFTITDGNGNIISEGNLDFGNQECIYINLGTLVSSTYYMTVIYGGYELEGSFTIE